MKKLCVAFSFAVMFSALNAQTVNEKLITNVSDGSDAYSVKYDLKSGGWLYTRYDTTARKYTLITAKGSSEPMSYIMQYNSVFDSDGNSYTCANDNVTDTTYKYYFLKNNQVVATYDYLNEAWAEKNGKIYFAMKENNKHYVASYDMKTGIFDRGKGYDEVRLVYIPRPVYEEGEPIGYVGFTKNGLPYYVASENNEVFYVIGTEEQKRYSDISWYESYFDADDNLCFIAKDKGKFYMDRGNTFVVQGQKEYTRYDWIYGPLKLSENKKNIMYVGQDSVSDYVLRSTLMIGPEVMKTYDGTIYEYKYSPDGKPAYVVSGENKTKSSEMVYSSTLVYGTKKYKNYNSISNLQFIDDKPAFTASDKNNKFFVVIDGEVMTGKYDFITDYRYLADGRFAYLATNYGNYEKKVPDKNFVFIDDEKFGPYDMLSTAEWQTYSYIVSDTKRNYAFISGKNNDKENYYYVYKVHTNSWESSTFDNITELRLVNGKTMFFGGSKLAKDVYVYNYQLYVNNKPVGDVYSAMTDVKVNGKMLTFIGVRGSNLYWVNVAL